MSNDPPTQPWSQFWAIIGGLVGIGVLAILAGITARGQSGAEFAAGGAVFILTAVILTVMALVRAAQRKRRD